MPTTFWGESQIIRDGLLLMIKESVAESKNTSAISPEMVYQRTSPENDEQSVVSHSLKEKKGSKLDTFKPLMDERID